MGTLNRRSFIKIMALSSFPVFSFGKIGLHDVIKDNYETKNLKDLTNFVKEESTDDEAILNAFLDPEEIIMKRKSVYAQRSTLRETGVRRLNLYNPHTGETFKRVYFSNGRYKQRVLSDLNYFMRDFREKKTKNIDVELVDLMYSLQRSISPTKPLNLLSGYRTKKTNAMLARTTRGVAKHSFHIKGKAVDLAPIDGSRLKLTRLKNQAKSKYIGGVGFYKRKGFVHVDTGPVRCWG